jgi:hypothetical protein
MARLRKGLSAAKRVEREVLTHALKLINEGVPGDTFVYRPRIAQPPLLSVPKRRVLTVFEWIVRQTKGFSVPGKVVFRYGRAIAIGHCLGNNLYPELNSRLLALNCAGVPVPRIVASWDVSWHNPYITLSHLPSSRWRSPAKAPRVIEIHDETEAPQSIVVKLGEIH